MGGDSRAPSKARTLVPALGAHKRLQPLINL